MENVKQEDESRLKLPSKGDRLITASSDDHLNEIFRKIKASKNPLSTTEHLGAVFAAKSFQHSVS